MAGSRVGNSASFSVTTPSDREIRLTRLFEAPPDLVFTAMYTPEHVAQWWGRLGPGYSVPVCEIDLRPGGAWRFVNRTPRRDVVFYGVYREIDRPGRVVYTEIFADFPDTESVVTSELTEERGRTRLTVTALYPSLEVRDMVLKTGMEKGAATSYDRLEDIVVGLRAR